MTITNIPFKLNYFDQGSGAEQLSVERFSPDGAIFVTCGPSREPIGLCKPSIQKAAMKALVEHEFLVELPPAPKNDYLFKNHCDIPRLQMERRIVWNLMKFLGAHGWYVSSVWDGEATVKDKTPVDAMETVFSVDDSRIRFRNKAYPEVRHSVSIILGNGEDCISDHSIRDEDNFEELQDQFPIDKVRDAVMVYAAPSPEVLDLIHKLKSGYNALLPVMNDSLVREAEALLKLYGRE